MERGDKIEFTKQIIGASGIILHDVGDTATIEEAVYEEDKIGHLTGYPTPGKLKWIKIVENPGSIYLPGSFQLIDSNN